MKRVGITQRVEFIQSHSEKRDCLDQRWSDLAQMLGYLPIPLPNNFLQPAELIEALSLDAVIFSGGNSLSIIDSEAADASPIRDKFEAQLFSACLDMRIPMLGICRGMQHINVLLGGSLAPISDHVAVRHALIPIEGNQGLPEEVNSYHSWCIPKNSLAAQLTTLAVDSDGNIEAFANRKNKILGIMWHPERETPFCDRDIQLIKSSL